MRNPPEGGNVSEALYLAWIALGAVSGVLAAVAYATGDLRVARVVVAVLAAWALLWIGQFGWIVYEAWRMSGGFGPDAKSAMLTRGISVFVNTTCLAPPPLLALAVALRLLR